jgi:hypothetical protein
VEEIRSGWGGYLSSKNIEQVAEFLRKLLTGKKFTLVKAKNFFYIPEVETCQALEVEIRVCHCADISLICVPCFHEVLVFRTNLQTEICNPPCPFTYVYIKNNQVAIETIISKKERYVCIFAVEED